MMIIKIVLLVLSLILFLGLVGLVIVFFYAIIKVMISITRRLLASMDKSVPEVHFFGDDIVYEEIKNNSTGNIEMNPEFHPKTQSNAEIIIKLITAIIGLLTVLISLLVILFKI